MERSKTHSVGHKVNSLHSEICVAYDIDFTYRRAYRGDWGHWDDLPDHSALNVDCSDIVESENSIGLSEVPNENSYL